MTAHQTLTATVYSHRKKPKFIKTPPCLLLGQAKLGFFCWLLVQVGYQFIQTLRLIHNLTLWNFHSMYLNNLIVHSGLTFSFPLPFFFFVYFYTFNDRRGTSSKQLVWKELNQKHFNLNEWKYKTGNIRFRSKAYDYGNIRCRSKAFQKFLYVSHSYTRETYGKKFRWKKKKQPVNNTYSQKSQVIRVVKQVSA